MSKARRSQPIEDKRSSDWGSYEYTPRDDKGLRLVAEMKFMPYDLLGQWLAPDLAPTIDEPRDEAEGKKKRGGKRDDVPWTWPAKMALPQLSC